VVIGPVVVVIQGGMVLVVVVPGGNGITSPFAWRGGFTITLTVLGIGLIAPWDYLTLRLEGRIHDHPYSTWDWTDCTLVIYNP